MNGKTNTKQWLALSGFLMSSLFILALTLSSLR